MGFPGGSVVKNLPANTGDLGSTPGSQRSPEEGTGNPLQHSCLGNPTDRGAWRATYSPWGCKESDATERLSLSFFPVELIRSQWVACGIWHWPCWLSVHKWELSLFSAVRRQRQPLGSMSLALRGPSGRQLPCLNFISLLLGKNPGWKPESPTFCTLGRSP